MTKYAIVENNTPRAAGKNAVIAHVEAQVPGKHPISAISSWTEHARNLLGVYSIQNGQFSAQPWQRKGGEILTYANDEVTRTWHVSDIPLDTYKATKVAACWVEANDRIENGTVAAQSNTAGAPVDHKFGTDDYTRSQVMNPIGTAMALGILPADVSLTPKGELASVAFTAAEFAAFSGAALLQVDGFVKDYLTRKSAILQAADHAAVDAIDIENNWAEHLN